ncbi:hypothetical protein CRYUN_Cryun08bG0134600 [Craigia yunnanensis]
MTAPRTMRNGFKAPNPSKVAKYQKHFMDDTDRIMYYGSDETDEQGQFNIVVSKYINGKELQAKSCLVRLVSSPPPTSNIPTNFAGGKTGMKLPIRPTVLYRDLVQYQLDTFFYTTPSVSDKPAAFECHGNNNY